MFEGLAIWATGKGLKYIVTGVAAAVIIGGLAWKWHDFKSDLIEQGRTAGKAEVQALWDADKVARDLEFVALQAAYKDAEQEYVSKVIILQQEHRHEVARIDANLQLALDGLRDRPEKRAAVPDAASLAAATEGRTGAELAGPDARFLTWYSADAAKLDSELNLCIAAHNQAVETINNLAHPSGPP